MAVEIYQGQYVTAESATSYIDVGTISSGCEQLSQAAEQFSSLGNNLSESASGLSEDALSVNGDTMQSAVEECGSQMSSIEGQLSGYIATIMSATESALDKKQLELNQIAEAQDKAMAAQIEASQIQE